MKTHMVLSIYKKSVFSADNSIRETEPDTVDHRVIFTQFKNSYKPVHPLLTFGQSPELWERASPC